MRRKQIWQIRKADENTVETLVREMGIARALAQVLVNRGFTSSREIRAFLSTTLEDMQSPQDIPGIREGAARVRTALNEGEKILVYGDYDVDGITATALITSLLRRLGGQVNYYIPDRMEEGYGLNPQAIIEAGGQGTRLIITVDCGISSCEEADLAAGLGMDLIITDHHQPPNILPRAYAVINPKTVPGQHPWSNLAGVGVAYKLAQAVAALCGRQEICTELLDLVALGTIADLVSLKGENRILVKEGLRSMSQRSRPGIEALMEVSGLKGREVSTEEVAYALAPRINACGRMSRADIGVELMLTKDQGQAYEMARILDRENQARQSLETEITEEAHALIGERINLSKDKIIVLASERWHPGVIGIVASRLVERYFRPTILIALENGIGKGSSRSIPGFNLYGALEYVKEHLVSFGGHEMAAGLTLHEKNIPFIIERLKGYADLVLTPKDLYPILHVDGEISWKEVGEDLIKGIEALAPFGFDNPLPVFVLRGKQITQCREVGANGSHLKLRITDNNYSLDAIAFKQGALKSAAASWEKCDLAFVPELNTWKGRSQVQLVIKDLKPQNEPDDPFAPQSFLDRLYTDGEIWLEEDYYRDVVNREEFYTKVVGVTFGGRQDLIGSICDGEAVTLRHDPDNSHDPFAVEVLYRDMAIGYLKAQLARNLAPALERGIEYQAYVTRITGREKETLGVNICIKKVLPEQNFQQLQSIRETLEQQTPEEIKEKIRLAILGEAQYHEKQAEAICALLNGDNSLVIFGTGRGKSAVFQTVAAYLALTKKCATIIIYPLRSLVNDQYRHLKEKLAPLGITVAAVNGSLSMEDKNDFFIKLAQGNIDIILTTPEFLEYHMDKFRSINERLGLFVVDEAHHLARGKRKGYRVLARNWRCLGKPLALAVTATADAEAARVIIEALECSKSIIEAHVRENLRLVDRRTERDKLDYLLELVSRGERMVIYVNSRKQAFQLARDLGLYLPRERESIGFYHGGLSSLDRVTLENMFREGALRVMVTTSAFGEGINIPDIKHVVLYHLCFSAAEFNQLAGRAGRNNDEAFIHILFGENDQKLNEFILESVTPSREVLGKLYLHLKELAQKNNPIQVTNQELQEAMQKLGAKSFREQTASTCLGIFEELGLLLREVEGSRRYIHFAPPPQGKMELSDSLRYMEGLGEWEEFQEFAAYILKEPAREIIGAINTPIYPKGQLA